MTGCSPKMKLPGGMNDVANVPRPFALVLRTSKGRQGEIEAGIRDNNPTRLSCSPSFNKEAPVKLPKLMVERVYE